jgi:SAM-dependent methyltransferase
MHERKEHWEKIHATKKPNEVSWYQQKPEKSLKLILESAESKESAIIDVGGGASTLADRLLELGYKRISVLDISEKALQCSKKRLGPAAEKVNWIEGDVTEFVLDGRFDLWHDRAVFHFLIEKSDRAKYIDRVKQSLKKDGFLILATFAMDGPDQCSGLPVRRYDTGLVLEEFGSGFDLVRELSENHITPWGKEQNFKYFLLKKKTG